MTKLAIFTREEKSVETHAKRGWNHEEGVRTGNGKDNNDNLPAVDQSNTEEIFMEISSTRVP